MAYGAIPDPGTTYGPCAEPCQHLDCAESRKTAAAACHYCGDPIGYRTNFQIDSEGPVHFTCAMKEIDP